MKEIKAREGYYLTQAQEVGENRIFVTAIKGANVNESDWREAIEEEKTAFEKAQEDKLKLEQDVTDIQ
jgi:hypothetical protein